MRDKGILFMIKYNGEECTPSYTVRLRLRGPTAPTRASIGLRLSHTIWRINRVLSYFHMNDPFFSSVRFIDPSNCLTGAVAPMPHIFRKR